MCLINAAPSNNDLKTFEGASFQNYLAMSLKGVKIEKDQFWQQCFKPTSRLARLFHFYSFKST
jgi:hypothetical protein